MRAPSGLLGRGYLGNAPEPQVPTRNPKPVMELRGHGSMWCDGSVV